ncbi:cyclic pyranopterin monophosphate synthase MoaC [Pelagibacterium montanilacus]|uniref:cyclic pyranopterin monophosphate synthase MoaC n=1 Tax=Pelagibacterium montanilacus TaxID=2185280 RepID=UPI000F8D2998|nr:cyclic pyranopterin monophosphate synthase MoaC [Pelagibacterium montanilacus]
MSRLPHIDEKGRANIVDIGGKDETIRRAVARADLICSAEVASAILAGGLQKGDAVAVARVAGIMAAKKTSELIPLCHPIALTKVTLDIGPGDADGMVSVEAIAQTTGRTGVEMEAMTAACVACLTLYDMAKGLDKAMTITDVRLIEKTGGKSGDFRRADP